jgi:SAM-dependent methyltransferase
MLLSDNITSLLRDFCSELMPVSTCPLCDNGSGQFKYLFNRWGFDHIECRNCELVFINPEPSQELLNDIYENLEYYTSWLELVEEPALMKGESLNYTMGDVNEWYRYIVDEILRWKTNGKWLDVGGGTGRFVKFINQYAPHFDTVLCETNPVASQMAEFYCGAKTMTWAGLEQQEGNFDVISLIAVFEHVPDSVEFMKKLAGLLAPGGIIYMAMPRLGYLSRHVSKEITYDIAPPMHLRFFSEKSMRCLISKVPELELCSVWQSGKKRFHIGHIFKPEWYEQMGVVPEHEGDMRRRIIVNPPATPSEKRVYGVMDWMDNVLLPVTTKIDGQRMLHCVCIIKKK